ncbi:prepilin peptidase [Sulfitobacter donghicola]|uniref:Membrane protein n=1 Tax=Sulfitobacter donghicola DSW-25 = KCTC 12864 = JCM 14565 TaxID=1300350 RepID=A0A073IFG7_9RHOB|nr:prepilin peptidase [Sulfitobacter donghicola]KEJ88246.1 membrane protein [Sulfitobacter donghicola DSW-25 = KCTC 12864 = JCM 14565]KIN68840.1 Membrane protein [Sulfitobacter donghicola DSW-25 = KCTC 12864 = JCM 14565]
MSISSYAALWFLPFVLPICFYVIYTDISRMKITNKANLALVGVFLVIGLIALPFDVYMWRLLSLVIVLIVGIVLNAAGVMGAGDSKFIAAAAPFIALGDVRFLMLLFAATLIAAFVAHRTAKFTPLRQLAPNWASWDQGKKFPMGLALGATLAIYLALGVLYGA